MFHIALFQPLEIYLMTQDNPQTLEYINGTSVHRSPANLFRDSIERSLGWASETELRDLVFRYTGIRLSLGEVNRFSQEIADLVVRSISGQRKSS
jgi:hypothetical protein